MGKVNIIKGGSIILQSGDGLKDEEVIPKSSFIISKTSVNKVHIKINGETHMFVDMSDVTIQDSSESSPETLTPANWGDKTKGINEIVGGGAGDGDMLKSVYDTNNNGAVDIAENALKLGGKTLSEIEQSSFPQITSGIFSTDISEGTANKDLILPAGFVCSQIIVKAGTNISNFKCDILNSGAGYQANLVSASTVNAGTMGVFTVLGNYNASIDSDDILRFNCTNNTSPGIEIIVNTRKY